MSETDKNQWKSHTGYIWSMLGSAVGFANLLGFGSQCYRNGGGAFLIPFFVAMFVLGIPMLCLEGKVGQRFQLPLVSAYGRSIGRIGKFFGWLSVIAVTTIGAFYTVLTGWTVAYTYFAAAGSIPADTSTFFVQTFLQDSGDLLNWGKLSISVLFATLAVVLFSWLVISRNIQSGIERWCSFFLPLLFGLILGFTLLVAGLPGAMEGFKAYLLPDFDKILDFRVWRDVFGHLFFSFSLGLGIVVGYSRHTDSKEKIFYSMVQVALADFLISFLAGLVIFGSLGYMAHLKGTPFSSIVEGTSIFDIGYVLFPMLLQTLGPVLSRFVGVLFFFSIFVAGVTGVFSIVESIAGNIEVEFKKSRRTAVTIAMAFMFMITIPFCMGNSTRIIDALQPMVLGYNMLIGGLAEIIVFMYLTKKIYEDPIWSLGKGKSFSYYSLKYLSLAILLVILGGSLLEDMREEFAAPELVRFAWLALAAGASALFACSGRNKETLPVPN